MADRHGNPVIPYEIIEHTADIGIRARGRHVEELFIHAAKGMFSLIVPLEEVQPTRTIRIKARSEEVPPDPRQAAGLLLVAWLRELLYLFDTQHFLVRELKVERLTPSEVEAEISGELLDLDRHGVEREVKAVTYHSLKVCQESDGTWVAEVIFDI